MSVDAMETATSNSELAEFLGKIHHQDCIEGMRQLPSGSVDLAFADPPFNIGFSYDEYDDRLEDAKYLDWSAQWMSEVHRVLKDDGAFWLAIGDEYAAELKVEAKKLGFHMRNWVIWYYTFGVHCRLKFTRSHAHLFYFLKDPKQFKFNSAEIAVPSARQLVYADKRANPEGRSPDDTWILRPQDCRDGFQGDEDTWYVPRVAGTFKERAGFHGCQMPEQLLGRIIRACTDEGDVVFDPFSGSSTTLTVAKKLRRKFFGFELSREYVERGTARLRNALEGDALEGAEEPRASAPSTFAHLRNTKLREPTLFEMAMNDEADGLIEAFANIHRGFSVDRVIADPILNEDFQTHCDRLAITGTPAERNRLLLQLCKSGRLKRDGIATTDRTEFDWHQVEGFLHASEIAWSRIGSHYEMSLDEILCDQRVAILFDHMAQKFAPGYTPLEYRWAAIKLRKAAIDRRSNLQNAAAKVESLFDQPEVPFEVACDQWREQNAGVYAIRSAVAEPGRYIYVGETHNLPLTLASFHAGKGQEAWSECGSIDLRIQVLPAPLEIRLANQLTLLQSIDGSYWNCRALSKIVSVTP
ncbi:MAG: DNA-methyltransferase [Planctomycetaceae bacterium]